MTRVDRFQAAEQTITLRVTPWRSLGVSRDIEMRLDQSLHALHDAIQQAFELDNDHLYAFYMNGNAFDRHHCYDDERCESGKNAKDTWLGQFALPTNKRFLYLFDFGDELRHHVKVVAWGQRQTDVRYPRVVAEVGKAPRQYPDRSFDAADEPAAIEDLHDHCGCDVATMAVLPEPERQELALLGPRIGGFVKLYEERRERSTGGATRSTAELAEELASACSVLRLTHGDWATVHVAVEHAMGHSVWGWLCSLPNELAEAGMNEGASELAQLVYAAVGEESLRMRMPRFLFRAGKVEEARALLLDNLREFPQEPAALLEAAKLEVSLGDMVAAESHYREALEWVGSNLRLRRQLVWELEALLTTTEQIEALHVLQRQEKRFLESLPSRLRAPKPLRREAPKVGRNDPCPCGSGKKSKKCCARAS